MLIMLISITFKSFCNLLVKTYYNNNNNNNLFYDTQRKYHCTLFFTSKYK